jgi:hypothetical protein
MRRADVDKIRNFLNELGFEDLDGWLGLQDGAPDSALEEALANKRKWAQAQQANRKHRDQALFVIKNRQLLHQALLEDRSSFAAGTQEAAADQHAEVLRLYIQGVVSDGVLTEADGRLIHTKGGGFGLAEGAIDALISAVCKTQAVVRSSESSVDFYQLLKVAPDATTLQIQRAIRERREWAGALADVAQSQQMLGALKEAQATLLHPTLRATHDQERQGEPDIVIPVSAAPTQAPRQRKEQRKEQRQAQAPRQAPVCRIHVDGPDQTHLHGLRSQAWDLTVTFEAPAGVHARIKADQPWLAVAPDRIGPGTTHIHLTWHPKRMPRHQGTALVSIVGSQGGRASHTVVGHRPRLARAAAALGAVILVLVGAFHALQPAEPPPKAPASMRLVIRPDPISAEVLVNGTLSSVQDITDIREGLLANQRIKVEVSLAGFATHKEVVVMKELVILEPRLELTNPLAFVPGDDDVRGQIDRDRIRKMLETASDRTAACFDGKLAGARIPTARLELTGWVSSRGRLIGVQIDRNEFRDPGIQPCIYRELAGLRYPLVAADYGSFHANWTQRTAPVEGDSP